MDADPKAFAAMQIEAEEIAFVDEQKFLKESRNVR